MNSPFLYSVKVWLSSVFIAPIIYGSFYILQDWGHSSAPLTDIGSLIQGYFGLSMAGAFLSFVTWLMFLGATIITYREVMVVTQRKLILSCVGGILTMLTFILFSSLFGSISDVPVIITFSYCACIIGGSLIYTPANN